MPEPEKEKATESSRPTDAELEAVANLETDDSNKAVPDKEPDEKEPDGEKEPDDDKVPDGDKESDKVDEPEKKAPDEDIDPDKVEDEPKSNTDRSRLGRRVAGMERQINDLVGAINKFVAVQGQPKDIKPDEVELDLDEPLTLRQMQDYFAKESQRRVEDSKSYTSSYVKTVWQLGQDEDDATLDEIAKELDDTTTYHRWSNDPTVDAERNYNRAARTVLARKLEAVAKRKESPLDKNKNKEKVPTKTGADTKVPEREAKLPELDGDAKDFLKYIAKGGKGFTEDDIRDALSRDIHSGKKDMRNI